GGGGAGERGGGGRWEGWWVDGGAPGGGSGRRSGQRRKTVRNEIAQSGRYVRNRRVESRSIGERDLQVRSIGVYDWFQCASIPRYHPWEIHEVQRQDRNRS